LTSPIELTDCHLSQTGGRGIDRNGPVEQKEKIGAADPSKGKEKSMIIVAVRSVAPWTSHLELTKNLSRRVPT
jgi:hypothetical protein